MFFLKTIRTCFCKNKKTFISDINRFIKNILYKTCSYVTQPNYVRKMVNENLLLFFKYKTFEKNKYFSIVKDGKK